MPESAPEPPRFTIDDELKEFLESGVAVILGTIDVSGRPRVNMAWGQRVHPGGSRVSVYLEQPRAAEVLPGFQSNPQIAVTSSHPVSVRSVQLKGVVVAVGEPNDAERQWITKHREAFLAGSALTGDSPTVVRNLWMEEETVRVDFDVHRAFDQTPGPDAGKPL